MCTKPLWNSALGCVLCGIPQNPKSHYPGLPHSNELFALLWTYSLGSNSTVCLLYPLYATKIPSHHRGKAHCAPRSPLPDSWGAAESSAQEEPSSFPDPPRFGRCSAPPQLGAQLLCSPHNAELLSLSRPLQSLYRISHPTRTTTYTQHTTHQSRARVSQDEYNLLCLHMEKPCYLCTWLLGYSNGQFGDYNSITHSATGSCKRLQEK